MYTIQHVCIICRLCTYIYTYVDDINWWYILFKMCKLVVDDMNRYIDDIDWWDAIQHVHTICRNYIYIYVYVYIDYINRWYAIQHV